MSIDPRLNRTVVFVARLFDTRMAQRQTVPCAEKMEELSLEDGVQTDDVKLSLVAINLLLNNGFKESADIFNKYR